MAALVASLMIFGGITPAQTTESDNKTASSVTQSDDYLIGVDDELAINVWKEIDLSRNLTVRPDGKITLPLVGDVQASGLTPKQLQDTLDRSLESYISKPVVTVIVQSARSQTFNVLGEVQKQGPYRLTGPLTVLDAIAVAGGFKEWAKKGKIYVLRKRTDGSSDRIPFNYKKAIKGGAEQNFRLQARDTVVVP